MLHSIFSCGVALRMALSCTKYSEDSGGRRQQVKAPSLYQADAEVGVLSDTGGGQCDGPPVQLAWCCGDNSTHLLSVGPLWEVPSLMPIADFQWR